MENDKPAPSRVQMQYRYPQGHQRMAAPRHDLTDPPGAWLYGDRMADHATEPSFLARRDALKRKGAQTRIGMVLR